MSLFEAKNKSIATKCNSQGYLLTTRYFTTCFSDHFYSANIGECALCGAFQVQVVCYQCPVLILSVMDLCVPLPLPSFGLCKLFCLGDNVGLEFLLTA